MLGTQRTAPALPAALTILVVSVTPHVGASRSADRGEHALAMEMESRVAFDEVRVNQIRSNPKTVAAPRGLAALLSVALAGKSAISNNRKQCVRHESMKSSMVRTLN